MRLPTKVLDSIQYAQHSDVGLKGGDIGLEDGDFGLEGSSFKEQQSESVERPLVFCYLAISVRH